MTAFEKHITIALTISATFILVNIFAVTSGTADQYYAGVDNMFDSAFIVSNE